MIDRIIAVIVIAIIGFFILRAILRYYSGTLKGPIDKFIIDTINGTHETNGGEYSDIGTHSDDNSISVTYPPGDLETEQREKFWNELIQKGRERGYWVGFIDNKDFGSSRYLQKKVEIPGKKTHDMFYRYILNKNSSMCQLIFYIGNEKRYYNLLKYKESITEDFERAFNGKIKWEYPAYRICAKLEVWFGVGWDTYNEDKWDEVQKYLIDAMDALEKATKKYL